MQMEKSVTLLYHFFYPDDVVSARHFTDLAEELADRGWKVKVLTSNRYCRYPKDKIPGKREQWRNIEVVRAYRPAWNQAKPLSRLANAAWLFVAWLLVISRERKTSLYLVGSDPQFSQVLFPFLKMVTRGRKIAYWCFDMYPEAIIADTDSSLMKALAKAVKPIMRACYRFTDLIVDLGPCMKKNLNAYSHNAQSATLTPWALKEPNSPVQKDASVREELFGTGVRLGLLYSGNLGKAHDYALFLNLARKLKHRDPGIRFTFAGRGNRFGALQSELGPEDTNIRIAGFASEEELERRLAAADIHLMSLRANWDGIVVPSKFFGSLAVGRPVLYAGSPESDIGQWVAQYECGLVLREEDIDSVADQLVQLAAEPETLRSWQENAFSAYQNEFSKKSVMDGWDRVLQQQING
jgi:glycosyltransferase involved in cell wall biosynthesis